ncbi:hypothetical protein JRO89_XS07G0171100 [Xanthoceras sorbifolium]|uniref:Uncharacterized protein n=1 Tax=Xanthoceras sorbifolium TaxID=99658 RepID=A0ABQ8HU95_9ROSI|nr:hypothetical protein JRO89_XS07G0171100 [Xanthoceras sorbifolium]
MDESSLQLVCDIGNQLARLTRFNKGLFLKSLKQAASAFSEIEQPLAPEASKKQDALKKLDAATKPLRKSIIKHGLLQQNDKDVRLFVAIFIFRARASLQLTSVFFFFFSFQGLFELIVNIFKELGDTTCPFFSRRAKILETVARCKCFVIMLDIDCNDLILEMFNNFFSIVRLTMGVTALYFILCSEHHQQNLINDILSIMTHILNEEVTQPVLEVILQNLVKQGKDVPSAASQLAVSVIQSCVGQLEPLVCGFLSSCFLDRDAVGSELKEFYHEIMFEIFQCAPQMILAVIPNLIQELLVDQVDVRIKAVNLIGKLFALPENHIVERYHDLYTEFLKRFSDKSAEVRVCILQCAKAFYLANPIGKESLEVLTALESRILDFDDRVRMEAVIVACDIARSNLKFVPPKLISEATERIRDKKMSVRKKALQKLLEVYRDYCKKCSEGHMTICNHFEQIPCKILMLCYDKDCKEFRSQNIERVLMDDLFPVLEIEERTRHWVHLFSLFTPLHVKALNSILSQKQRLRTEMQFYLSLRKKQKENRPEEMQKRLESSFVKMSALFPDPSKAEECFQRLNKMKDNNIFNVLEELLDELTIKGSQNAKHVRCILDDLSCNGLGDKHLEASSVKLLLAIISVFPLLLRGSELQFQKLLEGNDLIDDKLIEVLAKAGPHISVKFWSVKAWPQVHSTNMEIASARSRTWTLPKRSASYLMSFTYVIFVCHCSDFHPFLERMCLEGTRAQCKYAVSAIASLSGTSAQFVLTELCKIIGLVLVRQGLNEVGPFYDKPQILIKRDEKVIDEDADSFVVVTDEDEKDIEGSIGKDMCCKMNCSRFVIGDDADGVSNGSDRLIDLVDLLENVLDIQNGNFKDDMECDSELGESCKKSRSGRGTADSYEDLKLECFRFGVLEMRRMIKESIQRHVQIYRDQMEEIGGDFDVVRFPSESPMGEMGPILFRFENVWLEHHSFVNNVEEWWNEAEFQGWKGFSFKKMLE